MAEELYTFPRTFSREPRTAVGVSADGRTVIMVTVDGRRATSHGGTLTEMAELIVELGAFRAINLDGGGSTTMVRHGRRRRGEPPLRGWEREVINHIGVIAPPRSTRRGHAAGHAPGGRGRGRACTREPPRGDAATSPRERARACAAGSAGEVRSLSAAIDRLHLGRHREVVVPVLSVAAVLFVLSAMFWVVSRVRRARSRSLHARES
jgi:hypothetical protein